MRLPSKLYGLMTRYRVLLLAARLRSPFPMTPLFGRHTAGGAACQRRRSRAATWSRIFRRKRSKFSRTAPQQPIKIFKHEDVPVSLGLLIDNSGSMRDKRPRWKPRRWRWSKPRIREDEVFIVNFNDEAFLDVPFTTGFTNELESKAWHASIRAAAPPCAMPSACRSTT